MAVMRVCRGCGTRNPSTYTNCTQCRRLLLGSPLAPPRERDPSWGKELVEEARGRAEAMAACKSCGADNPVRFVRCQSCRGSTREVDLPAQVRCNGCGEWNRSRSTFCERCGDPLAETGSPAHWRPDGCPGCWGDLVAQPGLRFCGTCGAALPATLLERRTLLHGVVARRIGGGYRGQAHAPELHPARCELVLRDDATVLWATLSDSRSGVVDLELVVEPRDGDEEAPPPTPGSLVRLARWVRRRASAEAREADDAARAPVEAFANEDEQLVEHERVGRALHARIAFRREPSVTRLEAWLAAAPAWVVDAAPQIGASQ